MHAAALRLPCRDAAEADALAAALAPDCDGHAQVSVEAAAVVVRAEAATLLGLLRTLDDVIACARAAGVPHAAATDARQAQEQ